MRRHRPGAVPGAEELHHNHNHQGLGGPHAGRKDPLDRAAVQGDNTPEVLTRALSGLSSRWRNMWVRCILGIAMFSSYWLLIYTGPIGLIAMVLVLQAKCFHEIIGIGYVVYNSYKLPWFRCLSWYFLLCTNYFCYGETVVDYFSTGLHLGGTVRMLMRYHRFISFMLYLAGLCMFVLSLVKRYTRLQFYMFGWTHITLLLIVTQSHLVIHNLFEGMIWFVFPMCVVICNDIAAYIFGFFFGRTPLIEVSPKKTWEGFIGGYISTLVFGILLSHVLCGHRYFVCAVEPSGGTAARAAAFTMECEPSEMFRLTRYHAPALLHHVTGIESLWLYPFQLHALALSSFASLVGPFGGFFASGFKRAFQIKDFSSSIPGHGGIVDRVDCQYVVGTFTHVYISTFIRAPNVNKIIQQLLTLKPEQQLQIFNQLKDQLLSRGLI
ncbi:phosphatidate cytidylyltransferase 2-like isoform X2 [Petromyzon marinus]|uniref:Phosphatidate cytidylyltransferase n=1 Tax=Petromyzon marinus TaxID=7757 RepID=A0AAJ7TW01_PETMA|nr:phosphatidate cytidylyltransferase 2-like isoform X1 [Petromyzon marinus]XP_032825129.1 phosphatidate cytidylyltransferase 2-like isoform X1 [Petromyzon marinus]XP_032825130.1 phosphatidate cytidylyltransferase 2-like isoform X1 [Petromyzon marinus]